MHCIRMHTHMTHNVVVVFADVAPVELSDLQVCFHLRQL